MLAPLDAISLASAIVQFVDFGSKLTIEGYGAYRSTEGASEESQEVESATIRLTELSTRLRSARGLQGTDDEKALNDLARKCDALGDELLRILDDLKVKSAGPMRSWETVKKTIKRHVKAEEVHGIQQRLEKYQRDINTHLLSILSNRQSDVMISLQNITDIARDMHFVQIDHIDAQSADLKAALQRQTSALDTLGISSTHASNKGNAAMQRIEHLLYQVIQRLTKLEEETAMVATAQKILDSLMFTQMHDRHQQIHREHRETFSWVFDASTTPFRAWLENGNGVFWISGKAGSGKSTLMKFVANHETTQTVLRAWAIKRQSRLIQAKYFFWNVGSSMQKSQEGLLQSLVYQIFSQRPELISLASPARRWNAGPTFHRNPEPWELDELSETLANIVRHGQDQAISFCFFIDGLDEYLGDHGKLIDALDRFATSPCVKLCVSSRPWNVFRNAYDSNKSSRLYVHEYTKADMERYVKDQLEDDKRFRALASQDPRTLRLAVDIRDRAEGVFLWVFLVVRRLSRLIGEMQRMDNDTRFEALEHALGELPSDLDEYFALMIRAIEPEFRKHTAGTFKLAIYNAPLPLIAFYYFPIVVARPDEVLSAPIEHEDDDEDLVLRTTETVNAWCKDLVEVYQVRGHGVGKVSEHDYSINFLHRTVRDFLEQNGEVDGMFSKYLKPDFKPALTLMRLYLAQAKGLGIKSGADDDLVPFKGVVYDFMALAKAFEEAEKSSADARLLNELDRVGSHFRSLDNPSARQSHWTNAMTTLDPAFYGQGTLLAIAVAFDLYYYVKQQLIKGVEGITNKVGALLLNYALHQAVPVRESTGSRRIPSYDMVLLILEARASPNFDALGGHNTATTVWKLFLGRCQSRGEPEMWPIARLLLQFGADPSATFQEGVRTGESSIGLKSVHAARVGSGRAVDIPAYYTTVQGLSRCCETVADKTRMKEALVEAEQRRTAVRKREDKIQKQVEDSSSSLWLKIGRNLVPRQRRY